MEFKTKLGKHTLVVQTDKWASQASGSCLVKLGETTMLSVASCGQERENLDFFPLTCDYEERYYAAGKILGSRYIRREGRPTTEAILIDRLVDRSIRPLFPKELKREVQVMSTCLSWDAENDPDVLGIIGASLALSLSEIPWQGPVAALRIGRKDGKFFTNPSYEEREEAELDLVVVGVAGEKEGEILTNMLELQAAEVSEEIILEAIELARPVLRELIEFQKEIRKKQGKEKIPLVPKAEDPDLSKEVKKFLKNRLKKVLYQKDKQQRQSEEENLKEELLLKIDQEFGPGAAESSTEYGRSRSEAKKLFEEEKRTVLEETILEEEKRPDGRKLDEVREIKTEVGLLPRTHGSALFSRGETRALSILTLGAPGDQLLLEGMEISGKKRFLHHYNFPPYSVGEVRPLRAPSRREIGHGMLAEKALQPLIPKFEDFPYTIRVVSEMLSSNGSTSMASVSAASLALMDGGVPIRRPAAGIAIGLISRGTVPVQGQSPSYKLLTDIQGYEDSLGDMDFKVAGTEVGITALQMDVKLKGISQEILSQALERAKGARFQILAIQGKSLAEPRKELSVFAPRVYAININPEKIGAVIGTGGKVINEIIEDCGVSIDIEDSGKIFITAEKEESAQKAIAWIKNLTQEVKVGQTFQGKVKRIFDFGVVVEIFPGEDGLVHISELTDLRIENIRGLVGVGEIIPVKVIDIDQQGRVKLSAKKAGFSPRKTYASSPSKYAFKRAR